MHILIKKHCLLNYSRHLLEMSVSAPDVEQLVKLNNLHDEVLLGLELQVAGRVLHGLLKLEVPLPVHEGGRKGDEVMLLAH